MSKNININVKHMTRIEGHGNIVVNASEGKVEKVEWQVPEAPRFFEAMVRGRKYDDIQTIVSRICGICSISHSLVAIKAVEDAMSIKVSEQTDKLRLLMHFSEQLQSHVLHVGYLVAPDLFGAPSVVPLVGVAPDAVKTIIGVHRVANQMSEILAGRVTHPITVIPGGFSKVPEEAQLRQLQDLLKAQVEPLLAIVDVVLSVAAGLPAFERDTEYVSLKRDGDYTFYHGDIASSDGPVKPVNEWESVANEHVVAQSTAKWAKWNRKSYMAGALARFNNNAEHLSPLGKAVADKFGLVKGCCNPFMNNVAQLAEAAHVVEKSIELIDELLADGVKPEEVKVTPKAGKGYAAVEAPRGILFHHYEFNKDGICQGANLCIPTNQNHANIQLDFEAFVPQFMDQGEDRLRQGLEMLVRAYDPCVSCSTHFLDVQFV
ncbi:MAG: Ni/Fe hydrogenase subunit alpha [Planctomycetes bacterium]|nr:Ni/Fe hydrogenase subunit alpha [Planctomycetota bacterium]